VAFTYRLARGPLTWDLLLKGTNLLDEEARQHTSYIKDLAPLAGRAHSWRCAPPSNLTTVSCFDEVLSGVAAEANAVFQPKTRMPGFLHSLSLHRFSKAGPMIDPADSLIAAPGITKLDEWSGSKKEEPKKSY